MRSVVIARTLIRIAKGRAISMGAPILIDREDEMNPIEIAKKEFKAEQLPITIRRNSPEKRVPIIQKVEEPEEETGETKEEQGEENKDIEN